MTDQDERYVTITPKTGARLAAAIKTRLAAEPGFTQAELAQAVGTTQQAVANWENGHYMPKDDARFAIADATGTAYGEIFNDPRDEAGHAA